KGRPSAAPFDQIWEVLARFASRDECPRPDDRPCHELGPPGLAALEGLAVTTVVRTDREEADDDHPECDTRHESDREEHHRVSSFLRPKATRLAGACANLVPRRSLPWRHDNITSVCLARVPSPRLLGRSPSAA